VGAVSAGGAGLEGRCRVPLTGQELAAVAVFRRFLARAAEVGPDAALAEYEPALGEAAGWVAGAPDTGGR